MHDVSDNIRSLLISCIKCSSHKFPPLRHRTGPEHSLMSRTHFTVKYPMMGGPHSRTGGYPFRVECFSRCHNAFHMHPFLEHYVHVAHGPI